MSISKTEMTEQATDQVGLLNAEELLLHIWPNEKCRPSVRWIRLQQVARTLPFIKIGAKVFFDPVAVRAALDKRFTVSAK